MLFTVRVEGPEVHGARGKEGVWLRIILYQPRYNHQNGPAWHAPGTPQHPHSPTSGPAPHAARRRPTVPPRSNGCGPNRIHSHHGPATKAPACYSDGLTEEASADYGADEVHKEQVRSSHRMPCYAGALRD